MRVLKFQRRVNLLWNFLYRIWSWFVHRWCPTFPYWTYWSVPLPQGLSFKEKSLKSVWKNWS